MYIILIIIGILILIGVLSSKKEENKNKEMKKTLDKNLEILDKLGSVMEKSTNEIDKILKNRKTFSNSEKEFYKKNKIPDINFDRKNYLESLVVHASGLLNKENNYKVYFTDFNQNYVSPSSKNYENFKTNWMGIVYVTIKNDYFDLGVKDFIKGDKEFIYILGGILKKIDWLGSNLPLKIIEEYDGKSISDQVNILSKNCFENKMTEDDKEKVVESLSSLTNLFEVSLNQFKK
jgi:hypothetical protein